MGKVISVRIDKKLEEVIKKFSLQEQNEQSEIIRDLINGGSIFLAIKGYTKGRYSLSKAAYLANIPLSEFIDILTELGIKSNINVDEIIEGYENLKKIID
jgi:predicted HTH domain antitoxin